MVVVIVLKHESNSYDDVMASLAELVAHTSCEGIHQANVGLGGRDCRVVLSLTHSWLPLRDMSQWH